MSLAKRQKITIILSALKFKKIFSKLQKYSRKTSKGLFFIKPVNISVYREKSH